MTTEAQILANRSNAQKSTGPCTAQGKAIVAQNAVKHGFVGQRDVVKGEDQAQFDRHRERMLDALVPVGPVETMLVERIISLSWRLQRSVRLQNETFDLMNTADLSSPGAGLTASQPAQGPGGPPDDPDAGADDLALGRIAMKDFAQARVLERLLAYEWRMEHSLFKHISELKRLRLLRDLDAPLRVPLANYPPRVS